MDGGTVNVNRVVGSGDNRGKFRHIIISNHNDKLFITRDVDYNILITQEAAGTDVPITNLLSIVCL